MKEKVNLDLLVDALRIKDRSVKFLSRLHPQFSERFINQAYTMLWREQRSVIDMMKESPLRYHHNPNSFGNYYAGKAIYTKLRAHKLLTQLEVTM